MNFKIDLQLFGGGSSTTTQTYEPSDYELQLQKSQADYADAVAPNALWLNNIARDVLADSLGTIQVDYDALNKQAAAQNQEGLDYLRQAVRNNDNALSMASNELGKLYASVPEYVDSYVSKTDGLFSDTSKATNDYNQQLANLIPQYSKTAQAGIDSANRANAGLEGIASKYSNIYDKYEGVRNNLINGELPSAYLQNMQDAIAGTLKSTAGEGLNNLANRGVLNSSVTQKVLDNISKNAATATAQNYLNNINTIGGLLTSGTSDAVNLLGGQGNIYNQQYANIGNALDRNITALNQQGNLTQQQLNNVFQNNRFGLDVYNSQFNNQMSGLNAQQGLLNQYMNNVQSVNAQRGNVGQNIVGNATNGITTAAAAQEAAQTPASNLWNMSLGLNGSTTGALAAAAGKGTTTTKQSGGGGLFSGLLGGLF